MIGTTEQPWQEYISCVTAIIFHHLPGVLWDGGAESLPNVLKYLVKCLMGDRQPTHPMHTALPARGRCLV